MTGFEWVRLAAVAGFLAVAIGAFGAHGLKEQLEVRGTAATFQTGVQYHMYHALALLALGALAGPWRTGTAGTLAGWGFVFGTILFSGSLYVLAITGIKKFGAITPFGGVIWLLAWSGLFYGATTHSLFDRSERAADATKVDSTPLPAPVHEYDPADSLGPQS